MNDFKEQIKNKAGEKVSEEFKNKIKNAVVKSIEEVETSSINEDEKKIEYMRNLGKILENYDELETVIRNFLMMQDRLKINERDIRE